MADRLVWLLSCFELRAHVFQAGPLCHSTHFDAKDGFGHIHVLKSGSLKVDNNDQASFLVDEPSLIFYMNPTSHHLFPEDDHVDLVCATIDFGAGLRHPLSQALPQMLILKLADATTLSASLDLLFSEAQSQYCGRQLVLDRLVEVVVVHLLRDLMNENRLQFGLLAGLAEPKLSKAINAIHAEPARTWNLEDLAAVAGMSRARFADKFHQIVGMTPGQYMVDWRIGIAQSLLVRGKSVQHVAHAVGYGSASALSRVFMAQLGMSPREWKMHRES